MSEFREGSESKATMKFTHTIHIAEDHPTGFLVVRRSDDADTVWYAVTASGKTWADLPAVRSAMMETEWKIRGQIMTLDPGEEVMLPIRGL